MRGNKTSFISARLENISKNVLKPREIQQGEGKKKSNICINDHRCFLCVQKQAPTKTLQPLIQDAYWNDSYKEGCSRWMLETSSCCDSQTKRSFLFLVWIRNLWRECVNTLRGRDCFYRGKQRYNLCLWVQAGWLTVCISQARPAHSEICWHALIKHRRWDASPHLCRTF